MKIEVVQSEAQKRDFLDLPKRIYRSNRYWVNPLDSDIEAIFDPAKNELFEGGEAIRYVVRDDSGACVGRIAAFYNSELAKATTMPAGGVGFFESVNDMAVATLMFNTAREWLMSKGMEAMDGPINFGDRDQWWGLLVEGYEHQPLYANNYNPPYYKELFENYGFKNYFNQHTYLRRMSAGEMNPSVYEKAQRLFDNENYRFSYIDQKDMEKAAEDFRVIYNKAWALFTGVKPIDTVHAQQLMNAMRPILDPKLICFAYYNDEPIGFFIMVPDLNRIIGRFGGKLNFINKLRLMFLLKFTKIADRASAIIFGVVPEFHGKGIESGMMYKMEQTISSGELSKYKTLELAWIGDFNPVMMRMIESYVCAHKHKMHTTYRFIFDPSRAFERCPRLNIKRD